MSTDTERLKRHENAVLLMTKYGEAYRGSWADFDGRGLKHELNELAAYAENGTNASSIEEQIESKRMHGGPCWRDEISAHWTEFRTDLCGTGDDE